MTDCTEFMKEFEYAFLTSVTRHRILAIAWADGRLDVEDAKAEEGQRGPKNERSEALQLVRCLTTTWTATLGKDIARRHGQTHMASKQHARMRVCRVGTGACARDAPTHCLAGPSRAARCAARMS